MIRAMTTPSTVSMVTELTGKRRRVQNERIEVVVAEQVPGTEPRPTILLAGAGQAALVTGEP
jgi:hypothetical protein